MSLLTQKLKALAITHAGYDQPNAALICLEAIERINEFESQKECPKCGMSTEKNDE
jgi:hypothetical protein